MMRLCEADPWELIPKDCQENNQISSDLLNGVKSRTTRKRAALTVVLIFSIGCVLDHLTTGYGLTLPAVNEMNPLITQLMEYGVWHLVEALVIILGLLSGCIMADLPSIELFSIPASFLTSVGFLRLIFALNNLYVVICILI
jgi:hypothetical protein